MRERSMFGAVTDIATGAVFVAALVAAVGYVVMSAVSCANAQMDERRREVGAVRVACAELGVRERVSAAAVSHVQAAIDAAKEETR